MTKTKLIFDIDGVLVNTQKSYRATIKKTVEILLGQRISISVVDNIKRQEGFNNDWHAAYVLVNKAKKERFSFEAVKKVFQGIYLGTSTVPGLCQKETLIFSKHELSTLVKRFGSLSIITGRTLEEAEGVLRHFQIRDFFDTIISIENESLLSHPQYANWSHLGQDKSNAFYLHLVPKVNEYGRLFYVGDTVSDLKLVNNARASLPIESCFLLEAYPSYQRRELKKIAQTHHADHVFLDHTEGVRYLLKQ